MVKGFPLDQLPILYHFLLLITIYKFYKLEIKFRGQNIGVRPHNWFMAKIDEIKEEITLFRSLLITMIVIAVSLIGWIAQNEASNKLIYAFVSVVFLCVSIIWLLRIVIKKIKSLKDL